MTVEDIKKIYVEYLRRRETPNCEDVPVEVIVHDQDKQKK